MDRLDELLQGSAPKEPEASAIQCRWEDRNGHIRTESLKNWIKGSQHISDSSLELPITELSVRLRAVESVGYSSAVVVPRHAGYSLLFSDFWVAGPQLALNRSLPFQMPASPTTTSGTPRLSRSPPAGMSAFASPKNVMGAAYDSVVSRSPKLNADVMREIIKWILRWSDPSSKIRIDNLLGISYLASMVLEPGEGGREQAKDEEGEEQEQEIKNVLCFDFLSRSAVVNHSQAREILVAKRRAKGYGSEGGATGEGERGSFQMPVIRDLHAPVDSESVVLPLSIQDSPMVRRSAGSKLKDTIATLLKVCDPEDIHPGQASSSKINMCIETKFAGLVNIGAILPMFRLQGCRIVFFLYQDPASSKFLIHLVFEEENLRELKIQGKGGNDGSGGDDDARLIASIISEIRKRERGEAPQQGSPSVPTTGNSSKKRSWGLW